MTSSDTNSTSVIKKDPEQSYLGRGHLEDPGNAGSWATVASYKILGSYTVSSGFNHPVLAADQDTQLPGWDRSHFYPRWLHWHQQRASTSGALPWYPRLTSQLHLFPSPNCWEGCCSKMPRPALPAATKQPGCEHPAHTLSTLHCSILRSSSAYASLKGAFWKHCQPWLTAAGASSSWPSRRPAPVQGLLLRAPTDLFSLPVFSLLG